ncbi:CinA family protein [Bartonella sp. AR 15-3]|uniref:CinA family protein n=1 Tax=Bartonella sp. AR 15-3 TaxID=545617 RepID=UPI0001F4CEE5|nr:nicotinamide-nucleotide amidohydrolase family protein [Bartonella sp. AR 15-3]OPB31813.1 nicotinamide-nucleotide amidase [Bartonella sp. AR 15-3]CBI79154.1 Competence /damage-inducible protein cinA [Bartonella sp. AR 15-3]
MTHFCETLANAVLKVCRERNLLLTTVESCTGGLIAANLTSIAGSSDVFDCGFIVYSNESKTNLVGVSPELIKTYKSVSKEVAIAMAEGGLKYSRASISVAVTGIAGPGGAYLDQPVGLVHCATAYKKHATMHQEMRFGNSDRNVIRHMTVENALNLILKYFE